MGHHNGRQDKKPPRKKLTHRFDNKNTPYKDFDRWFSKLLATYISNAEPKLHIPPPIHSTHNSILPYDIFTSVMKLAIYSTLIVESLTYNFFMFLVLFCIITYATWCCSITAFWISSACSWLFLAKLICGHLVPWINHTRPVYMFCVCLKNANNVHWTFIFREGF